MSKNDMLLHSSVLTRSSLNALIKAYDIPEELDPRLPENGENITKLPAGYFGINSKFFEFLNLRFPLTLFFLQTFQSLGLHFTQMCLPGLAKIIHFEMVCRADDVIPTVGLFR
jgi:hypothetical protein